jgi:type II secretion system protein I
MKNKRATIVGTFRSAFTFIEVLIALVIVSISLLALIRLHLISINMTEAAEIKSQAVLLANEKITEILALGYPEEGSKSGTVEINALGLHWQTQVTDINPHQLGELDIEGLRRILVDVSWEQGIRLKHI